MRGNRDQTYIAALTAIGIVVATNGHQPGIFTLAASIGLQ